MHGYGFVYAEIPNGLQINLSGSGRQVWRHSAWMKLLLVAIISARAKRWVIYIDSDMTFHNQQLAYHSYLRSTQLLRVQNPRNRFSPVARLSRRTSEQLKHNGSLFMLANHPWTRTPPKYALACTGFQAWRIPLDRRLLAAWWHVDTTTRILEGTRDTWEQEAFDSDIYPAFYNKVGILDDTFFRDYSPEQYLRHVAHTGATGNRTRIFGAILRLLQWGKLTRDREALRWSLHALERSVEQFTEQQLRAAAAALGR